MTSNTLKCGSSLPEPCSKMSPPTDEDFEAVLSKKLAFKPTRLMGVSNFRIHPDGEWRYKQACHGGWYNLVDENRKYIVNAINYAAEEKYKSFVPKFIEWLIYHSPWHACIDPRLTVELAMEHQLIVSDLRYPMQYVHGINLCIRMLNEHPAAYQRWCDLMETEKFDGTFAFICAFMFNHKDSSYGGGHHGCPINQYLPIETIKNLLSHRAVDYANKPCHASQAYTGCNRVFQSGLPYDKKTFASEMNEIIKLGELKSGKDAEKPKKPDPFGRKDPSETHIYGDFPISYGNDTVKAATAFKIWLTSKGVSFDTITKTEET